MRYELTIRFQRRRQLPGWVHRHGWRLGRWLPHSVTYFQLTAHTEQGELAEAIQAQSLGVVGTRDEGEGGWGNPRPAETGPLPGQGEG